MCHLQRHTGFHHAIAESPDDFGNGTVKDAVISVLPQVPVVGVKKLPVYGNNDP